MLSMSQEADQLCLCQSTPQLGGIGSGIGIDVKFTRLSKRICFITIDDGCDSVPF